MMKTFLLSSTLLQYGAVVIFVSCCFDLLARAQVTDPVEVNALNAIRESLIDPYNNLENWGSGDPCTSMWTGVICTTAPQNGYLHVQQLALLNSNLSGNLAPELGLLSQLEILDFMWNNISGIIPSDIGNITSLSLLLLNGNRLSGSLPETLGNLVNMDRIQIDENQISGPIPNSFANLNKTRHFHMNNNSLSGQIPPGFHRLGSALHLLLDNNNLSGYLPEDISRMPSLQILQLDNNNFSRSSIPSSYGNIPTLQKLSLRNCSLQGFVPDLSRITHLTYIDLSWNDLQGQIPTGRLSNNITTIDFSNNFLTGYIPSTFSGLPNLQLLSLQNNILSGSVPPIWENTQLKPNQSLILNFQNNSLTNFSSSFIPPYNISILLYGNPVCKNSSLTNMALFCQPQTVNPGSKSSTNSTCGSCPADYFERNPSTCICAIPIGIGYRLKSPAMSDFHPYSDYFTTVLTSSLVLAQDQLYIDSYAWEEGPRLRLFLKVFPNDSSLFEQTEIVRITNLLDEWQITLPGIFGPYELLNFTLGYYSGEFQTQGSGLSKGAVVGIVLGAVVFAAILSVAITIFIMRKIYLPRGFGRSKSSSEKVHIRIDGVTSFTSEEMALATNSFSGESQVGEGGYGKVYKGTLADGTVVAVKRAQAGSLQGSKEFFTEIELLSRLHHRNLVSLLGYCIEEGEQMLVYEFMPNGSLRDHLSATSKVPFNFSLRLRIALGSARGILYLHSEADPPIFHRDIKASNILLDSKFVAKVADFGLSRLAPIPNIEGNIPDHVSTVVKGTPGYLDPEYFLTHKLTDKSDVYSLGVVLLELLTGLQPIYHGKNIVREVSIAYRLGKVFSIIDSRMGAYPSDCAEKLVTLALRCCKDETEARPAMSEVVRELESIWKMMPQVDSITADSIYSGAPLGVDNSASSSSATAAAQDRSNSATASSSAAAIYMSSVAFESYDTGCDDVSHAISTINPR